MAVEELLSVVGLPARQGLLSALDRPNRPQGPTYPLIPGTPYLVCFDVLRVIDPRLQVTRR
jgi:hypothetical protein